MPFVVLAIYIIIVLLINYKLVNNVIDIIPIINIIIYAIALWTKKIRNIKVVGIITCITGVVYDLTNKAYITVLNEIIDGIVGIISLGVLLKKKESGTN